MRVANSVHLSFALGRAWVTQTFLHEFSSDC